MLRENLKSFLPMQDWKGRANMRLAQALVGATQISTKYWPFNIWSRPNARVQVVQELSTMVFQRCSRQYSGSLKLSSRRFECTQNRSTPFLILFSIAREIAKRFGAVLCDNILCAKFGVQIARACIPFSRELLEWDGSRTDSHTPHCRSTAAAWTHH